MSRTVHPLLMLPKNGDYVTISASKRAEDRYRLESVVKISAELYSSEIKLELVFPIFHPSKDTFSFVCSRNNLHQSLISLGNW